MLNLFLENIILLGDTFVFILKFLELGLSFLELIIHLLGPDLLLKLLCNCFSTFKSGDQCLISGELLLIELLDLFMICYFLLETALEDNYVHSLATLGHFHLT